MKAKTRLICLVVVIVIFITVLYFTSSLESRKKKTTLVNSSISARKSRKDLQRKYILSHADLRSNNIKSPLKIRKHVENNVFHVRKSLIQAAKDDDKPNTEILHSNGHPGVRDDSCNIGTISNGPPLTRWEKRDIDFNIERTFTFGQVGTAGTVNEQTHPIPKIIHMIWSRDIIPTVFVDNVKSFVPLNPEWDIYFWTLKDGEYFIREHYPNLLPVYTGYKQAVSRSDALRYLAVYHYGGAYFDLDTKCLKSLDPLLVNEECIVSPEPIEHAAVVLQMRSALGTGALLCRPKHELYRFILDQLSYSALATGTMAIAGPTFLTKAVNDFIYKNVNRDECNKITFDIVSHQLFFDRLKPNVGDTLIQKCLNGESLNVIKEKHFAEACLHWSRRGRSKRILSRGAFTDRQYFGSYVPEERRRLGLKRENRIENIVRNVKRYPFEHVPIE